MKYSIPIYSSRGNTLSYSRDDFSIKRLMADYPDIWAAFIDEGHDAELIAIARENSSHFHNKITAEINKKLEPMVPALRFLTANVQRNIGSRLRYRRLALLKNTSTKISYACFPHALFTYKICDLTLSEDTFFVRSDTDFENYEDIPEEIKRHFSHEDYVLEVRATCTKIATYERCMRDICRTYALVKIDKNKNE